MPEPIVIQPYASPDQLVVIWRSREQVRCARFKIEPFIDPATNNGLRYFALRKANGFDEWLITDSTFISRDNAVKRMNYEIALLLGQPHEI